MFLSARSVNLLQDITEDLKKTYNVPVEYTSIDVTKEETVKAAVDAAIKVFGKIDIVISNGTSELQS